MPFSLDCQLSSGSPRESRRVPSHRNPLLVPVPKGRMGVAHQLALGSPHKSGERRDRAAKALSVHFSSVQLRPTLCDPMNRSMPGFPVHHQLPEFTQTHVHRVSDAIQPSHPLSSPSPPAPDPSQHQSLFYWSLGEDFCRSRNKR